tara:strand:+ start:14635 stop:15075 length:441 start_codon:yes stop_codon:yes gene_type:complete
MKILPVLSEIISKKTLISTLKSMDFSQKEVENEVEYYLKWVKNLPKTQKGYRILVVNDKKDINLDEIGSHFSTNKVELLSNHSFCVGCGDKYFLITSEIPKNEVDIEESIKNNILYPNENEITVKNKGKNVKILSIQEINTENDYF